jgi:thiol:disulfide interchange protein
MRRTVLHGALASFAALMTMRAAMAAPGMPWAKTLPDALAQAKKSNKLVMLDFYTDW